MGTALVVAAVQPEEGLEAVLERVERKNARGRPTLYTHELAAEICLKIAEGYTLAAVCKDEKMPCRRTVLRWTMNRQDFYELYSAAQKQRIESWVEDIIDIADNNETTFAPAAEMFGESTIIQPDVKRDKLRINSRQWILAKLAPRRFGKVFDDPKDPGADAKVVDGQPDSSLGEAQSLFLKTFG